MTHRKEAESLQAEQQRVQAENDSAKDEALPTFIFVNHFVIFRVHNVCMTPLFAVIIQSLLRLSNYMPDRRSFFAVIVTYHCMCINLTTA